MTEARIPLPRRIARTPVVTQPSALSAIGVALSTAGQALGEHQRADRATEERVADIEHRIALQEQQRQDDALFIEKSAEWVQLQSEAATHAAELRQGAQPFAHGHAEAMRGWMDDRFRKFDEALAGNERVRQRFRPQIVQSAARIDLQEQDWQRQQSFKAQGDSLEMVTTTLRNQLSRADADGAGDAFARATAQVDTLIDAGSFNTDQAAMMKRAAHTELAQGMVDSQFNAGRPQAVQALIDKGFFDGLDIDVDKLGEQVNGEQRALEIASERAQAERQSAAREAIAAIDAKVSLGINPTADEFAAARAAARAAGLPQDELIKLDGQSVKMGLNRQYSEAADPMGIGAARTAAALREKVAAGTASEAEQVAYRHLGGVADARAKAAGARLKELAGQGVPGQLAVLAQIDAMPAAQRFEAAQAAHDGLGFVAGLRPRTREFALKGRELRLARPKDFGTSDEIDAAFKEAMGAAAGTVGGNYDELRDLAWDIYAASRAATGKSGFDAAGVASAASLAMGQTRRADGTMQGGIGDFRGHKVVLPEWQTPAEFERMVRRLTFSSAVYADGSAANPGDVIGHYRPEWYRDLADGRPVYRMVDARNRPLLKRGGGVWDFVAVRGTPPARSERFKAPGYADIRTGGGL